MGLAEEGNPTLNTGLWHLILAWIPNWLEKCWREPAESALPFLFPDQWCNKAVLPSCLPDQDEMNSSNT